MGELHHVCLIMTNFTTFAFNKLVSEKSGKVVEPEAKVDSVAEPETVVAKVKRAVKRVVKK